MKNIEERVEELLCEGTKPTEIRKIIREEFKKPFSKSKLDSIIDDLYYEKKIALVDYEVFTKRNSDLNCSICGRALTDPISITRGIGPECFLGDKKKKSKKEVEQKEVKIEDTISLYMFDNKQDIVSTQYLYDHIKEKHNEKNHDEIIKSILDFVGNSDGFYIFGSGPGSNDINSKFATIMKRSYYGNYNR
jgi:hypothetical protein